ncbi:hypothetical protein TEU_02260 [Thermococcus eurythermalis]|uniref:Uncharacterized protein n=1 Tax=Thermococcus eurythermalis TaxID=1505907 RepID=A0A097QS04_9EURY|nr:hypothetical protein [Thermococcus eurythermalis]AIU69257.1 hypothetical protein TEU_02260 [Thermococcus eurythermalis]
MSQVTAEIEEKTLTRIKVSDLEFPPLDKVQDEVPVITPRMFIIKRYRTPKEESTPYKYLFYPATITDEVVGSFKEILSTYIDYISELETESIPMYHPDLEEFPCYVELTSDGFPYWSYFVNVLRLDYEAKAPKNIESNLWGYLFYLRAPYYAIGYAKRLSKSKIVKKKRFLKGGLVDRNIVFNSVEEIDGIEFDESVDFLFVVKFSKNDPNQVKSSWGIIWNKNGFESLLNVYEYQKQKALEVLEQCNTLQSVLTDEDLQNFKQTVESNRQLHKMLLHPVTKQYMNEATIEDFKWVKEKFGDEVSFDIDEDSNRVILPPTDSEEYKKAVREVLGVIGARFTKTLNDQHISKGKPEELR